MAMQSQSFNYPIDQVGMIKLITVSKKIKGQMQQNASASMSWELQHLRCFFNPGVPGPTLYIAIVEKRKFMSNQKINCAE